MVYFESYSVHPDCKLEQLCSQEVSKVINLSIQSKKGPRTTISFKFGIFLKPAAIKTKRICVKMSINETLRRTNFFKNAFFGFVFLLSLSLYFFLKARNFLIKSKEKSKVIFLFSCEKKNQVWRRKKKLVQSRHKKLMFWSD